MLARLARLGLIAGLIAMVVLPGVAAAQTATKMTFTFGPGRNATQAGTVTLEPVGAQTKVTIEVASGGAGVSQPAHIHTGACPGVGGVAFPLTNVVDGKSETTVNATAAQIMATAHSINIHRSTTEAAVYTACVELPLQSATMLKLPFSPGRNASQAGTVTLEDAGAQTKVTINAVSGGAGVSQPAHVHTGSCPGVGGVAFPLTNVVDGKSETTINATRAQLSAARHSINIHRSTTEAAVYTACAELPLAAAALPRTGGVPLVLYGLLAAGIAGIGFALRRRSA